MDKIEKTPAFYLREISDLRSNLDKVIKEEERKIEQMTRDYKKELLASKSTVRTKINSFLQKTDRKFFFGQSTGKIQTIIHFWENIDHTDLHYYIVSWKKGERNIFMQYYRIKIEDVNASTLHKMKTHMFSKNTSVHVGIKIPVHVKNAFVEMKKILNNHHSLDAKADYDKLLKSWLKSLIEEHVEKAAITKETSIKFGL